LQQDLFAQHPIVHALPAGALERMHAAAGSRTALSKSAAARINDMLILPIIALSK
jgi:hypothetical protein